MSFGIKITHPETGNVVIDENYMNSALVYSGYIKDLPLVNSSYYGIPNAKAYVLPNLKQFTAPFVAVELRTDLWCATGTVGSKNTLEPIGYIFVYGNLPQDAKYYIFASNLTTNVVGSYGLRVNNIKGELCYDSRMKYLKVFGSITGNGLSPSNSINTAISSPNINPSSKYALVLPISVRGWSVTTVGGIAYGAATMCFYKIGSNLVQATRPQAAANPNATGFEANIFSTANIGFVIDVTNY